MAGAVTCHAPASFRTVVAIVDDADTFVDGVADRSGASTGTLVKLGDVLISVMLKCVAD